MKPACKARTPKQVRKLSTYVMTFDRYQHMCQVLQGMRTDIRRIPNQLKGFMNMPLIDAKVASFQEYGELCAQIAQQIDNYRNLIVKIVELMQRGNKDITQIPYVLVSNLFVLARYSRIEAHKVVRSAQQFMLLHGPATKVRCGCGGDERSISDIL